ncbi:diaminopimelate decarboxylase [bacterium]|nr:diaminopimelate decarboxylase [bacterium]
MKKTANQNIKPITTTINGKQHLEIGGCDLVELAQQYGTPLMVYDYQTIKSICEDYKNAFANYPNIQMLYASKAFMTKGICQIVSKYGFGFDLVSGGEIYTAHSANVDMATTLFNGNNKTLDEIKLALNVGVGIFSADNYFELEHLNNLSKEQNKISNILLRITPGIECHTHEYIQTGHLDSKFGFDLTQLDNAIEKILKDFKNLNIKGLHAHIGSQIFETKVYEDEVKIILKEIKRLNKKFGINLNEVNLGGGLGITYTDKDFPPSIYEIAQIITNTIKSTCDELNLELPKIYIEPGRSIVGTSGITLYTIGSTKTVPNGRTYFAVDGGMADNVRPAMYQAEYTIECANKITEEKNKTVTLSGRFCESGDIIKKDVKMPELQDGDVICVYNTGAYGYSMASNYNRVQKPCVVLVNNSQSAMIVRRESLDDLVAHDEMIDSSLLS